MKAVYRIVNALLALSVFPVLYFADLIYIEVSTSLGKAAMYETFSVQDFVKMATGKSDYSPLISIFTKDEAKVFRWPEQFSIINGRLIAMGVLFAVIIAIALFIIIWSCCSNKRIPPLVASVIGLGCVIAIAAIFPGVEKCFTTGLINVVSAFAGSGIITTLLGSVVGIAALKFTGVRNGLIIVFICLIVWTVIYYLSELGDNEAETKTKK